MHMIMTDSLTRVGENIGISKSKTVFKIQRNGGMPSVNLIRLREAFCFPLSGFMIGSILGLLCFFLFLMILITAQSSTVTEHNYSIYYVISRLLSLY